MTNYIKQLDVQNCIDRLEKRLGKPFMKSQYTRLEDTLSPSDPDMMIILELRAKTRDRSYARKKRHHNNWAIRRLQENRETIKEQLLAGWNRKRIAKAYRVSPSTITGFIQGDAELNGINKIRGHQVISPEKVKQIIELYRAGKTRYYIAKELHLNKKTVARYITNYKLGVLQV